ncbi:MULTISPECIES: aspartate/glutamate racemase family protein [Rhodococcus]|uniref:aspartate/glutamate racemase family protein n=1 Tax=Rhodococcus TaxID=1827 RepID=UPI001E55ED54|nr:aspartate/glutamate racemase family protein [Rhodococcus pyridinivorans]MCD2118258.1 aspartate racemase [Rhodococcus pyridinivorans]MCZ4627129.1 aspartate racemase [Rhodococcus pyridinivorans]MCZ4648333.1 aspartate racemase [Rhodococcus pyridinivorans]MDJ0481047.1 aspartate racemase [Rhodococcus pyridinivorans]MDV7254492.1 aspartate racemase [Rhodococcus pyridinivorans]
MKHVGILGHSWEGASLCWREVCQHSNRLGHPAHPDVTMDCISFEHCMPAWERGDYEAVRAMLATSVDRLAWAGCDFFVCPDNTAHLALEAPGDPLTIPGLHLIDIVADAAQRAGHRRVGISGNAVHDDQDLVHAAIFDELVHGIFRDETRTSFVDLIGRLADSGCDAVALVCTEIPLLVSPADSPLPVLDSTRLSGQAALEVALGTRDLPTWRGGQFR